jgi:hypothetical protein
MTVVIIEFFVDVLLTFDRRKSICQRTRISETYTFFAVYCTEFIIQSKLSLTVKLSLSVTLTVKNIFLASVIKCTVFRSFALINSYLCNK